MTKFEITVTMIWGQTIKIATISATDERAALDEAKSRYFLPGRGMKSFTATAC